MLKQVLFGSDGFSTGDGSLTPGDWRKTLRHFLVVIASAAVAAGFTEITQTIAPQLMSHVPPVVTALGLTSLVSPALEAARRKVAAYLVSLDTQ